MRRSPAWADPAEQRVSPDVERILGRPARSCADRARRPICVFR
ncbi:hypothetical protein [Streptomyces sp. NPDC052036]